MDIKVRVLESAETKGVAEREQELLDKHAEKMRQEEEAAKAAAAQAEASAAAQGGGEGGGSDSSEDGDDSDLDEQKVLSFIGKRYNKQINSFEELMAERQAEEPLPEDVAAYLKFKKETGRGFDDFLKLREDFDSMDSDKLLRRYFSATQQGLDDEDIDVLLRDFKVDEDDDEFRQQKVKIAKKQKVAEAKRFFNEQKEKYKAPLESSAASIPDSEMEEFKAFKQYTQNAKSIQEENELKRQWFEKKTNELLSTEFKGFEFKIDNKVLKFLPGDVAEIKKTQSTPMNFISKFLDEKGLMKDAAGYHRALAVAMNPEKFAQHFYEQGKADALEQKMKGIKNINMGERKAPDVAPKGGLQVKPVNPDSGRGLKIRSIKKV